MSRLAVLILLTLEAVIAQVPRYVSPNYPLLSVPQLQSIASSSSVYASPRRSLSTYGSASSSSKYGLPGAPANPSIVAIPLYVRNLGNADNRRYPTAASTKYSSYASYIPKKSSSLDAYARYEKPVSSYSSYSKYDSPKSSSSSYEPIRYEIKNTDPGYGDASSVSLLSSAYGSGSGSSGAVSIAYPPSRSSGQGSLPRLRAVDYDENQKSALADFASALENFDLKAIKNEDMYDLPPINPPTSSSSSYGSQRLAVSNKKEAVRQAVAAANDDGYGASSAVYAKAPSSYGSSSQSSYDDRSYDRPSSQGGYGQSASAGDYASASSDGYRSSQAERVESYRPQVDSYRSPAVDNYRSPAESYRAASDPYRSAPSEVFRNVERQVDSYRNQESAYDNQDAYVTRQPASYASASSEYARQNDPNDPNCPYKDQDYPTASSSAQTSSYGTTSKLAAALSSAAKQQESESAYERPSLAGLTGSGRGQGYENDELDPSKLDLKIVHLPVSVLKRLVGNGELALPSFQKKKK